MPPATQIAGCYAAGPLARVRLLVWDWPEVSVQLTAIESPGWYLTRLCATSCAEVTG